jgi:hypothetical protein
MKCDVSDRATSLMRVVVAYSSLGDSEFFIECCTNCSAVRVNSDAHRCDIATHSLLGGQYGEEGKESEEGQEGEEEEEVVLLLTTTRSTAMSRAASQRPTRP